MGVKFGVNPALLSDFFARNIKTHEMEALSKGGRNGNHMLGFVKRPKKSVLTARSNLPPS